jgi:hypothetical protein
MTDTLSKAELLAKIQQAWDDLHRYLNTLTEAQQTQPADPAGWTVKDHVIHLAVWEDGTNALLRGESRREQMGVDEATWLTQEYDKINDVIYQTHHAKPLSEVMQTLNDVHKQMLEKLESMSDEDIVRPHSFYQKGSTNERPIIAWISGSTHEHYAEHLPWIVAIIAGN